MASGSTHRARVRVIANRKLKWLPAGIDIQQDLEPYI